MAIVGVLTLELRLEHSRSLKDKRQVVQGLKERLRKKFNVAIAEIGCQDLWQRTVIAVVTVSGDRRYAERLLQAVEEDAAHVLGADLVEAGVEWLE